MKQSSNYASYDAEQNGLQNIAIMLKDRSVTGVPMLRVVEIKVAVFWGRRGRFPRIGGSDSAKVSGES